MTPVVGWWLVLGCGGGTVTLSPGSSSDATPLGPLTDSARGDTADGLDGVEPPGFAQDFADYLQAHGSADLVAAGGVGGGGAPAGPAHDPVVFVHGNGDRALGGPLGGWTVPIEAYVDAGWSENRLFALTWGPADPSLASQQAHDRANVLAVRRFLDAVLAYTAAERVDVVAHSMGVTLARAAIAGGTMADEVGDYEVGPALTGRVDAFVAIAGANLGLASCWPTGGWVPTCGRVDGLWPGTRYGWGDVIGRSEVLERLGQRPGTEGERRYAIWSRTDEILGVGGLVWGEVTARLPDQTDEVVLSGVGHLDTRDVPTAVQLGWLDAP